MLKPDKFLFLKGIKLLASRRMNIDFHPHFLVGGDAYAIIIHTKLHSLNLAMSKKGIIRLNTQKNVVFFRKLLHSVDRH